MDLSFIVRRVKSFGRFLAGSRHSSLEPVSSVHGGGRLLPINPLSLTTITSSTSSVTDEQCSLSLARNKRTGAGPMLMISKHLRSKGGGSTEASRDFDTATKRAVVTDRYQCTYELRDGSRVSWHSYNTEGIRLITLQGQITLDDRDALVFLREFHIWKLDPACFWTWISC